MAKYYAESHEWIELDGTTATLGISKYAADSLGDITYVEIPVPGKAVAAGDTPDSDMPPVMRRVPVKGGIALEGPWTVRLGEGTFDRLGDWTKSDDPAVRYFSGTATYTTSFALDEAKGIDRLLMLGAVAGGLAEVVVNGTDCGIAWCAPWQVKVPAAALRRGENALEVRVTNTWRNRLIGDCLLPPEKRLTRSCLEYKAGPLNDAYGEVRFRDRASGYSANDSLVSCGLYGPVLLR